MAFSAAMIACAAIVTYPGLDGWFFYRDGWEIVTSLARLTTMSLLIGLIMGAGVTALLSLLIMRVRNVSRLHRIWRHTYQVVIGLLAVVVVCLFLHNVVAWLVATNIMPSAPTARFGNWLVRLLFLAGAAAVVFRRRQFSPTFNRFFASGMTRRNVIALGGSAAALTAADLAFPAYAVSAPASRSGSGSAPNILLVVFDALSAEDMSCYGYGLPTTPHIDHFAETATTFWQHYACSTFTTPSVVGFNCGRYPSSTRVFQLRGALQGGDRAKTLPYVLQAAGYETAASAANIAAHPHITCVGGYTLAPPPPFDDAFIRATFACGEPALADDAWNLVGLADNALGRMIELANPSADMRAFPPRDSFAQAELLWRKLRGPKFLQVHVMAPHKPYQPSPQFRGRFVDSAKLLYKQVSKYASSNGAYQLQHQPFFDELRLRYNEWIADADAAFGSFLAGLEASGQLTNTIVAITADHGESFEGGSYGHGGASQLRSIIHVPLIVRTPGQARKTDVRVAVDAVSLAPTLLDLAGITVPRWMDGASMRGAMESSQVVDRGYAFTQYFERNSAFKPITNGTVGVVDGSHQYVVDLRSGKGRLYDLSNAHLQNREISAREPAVARVLREHIRMRFSDLAIPA